MEEAGARSYRNVLAYMTRTPWAITHEAFDVINEVMSARLDGWRPSAAESEALEQLAASRPGPARVGSVAVIPLQGMLVPRASLFSAMSGGTSMDSFSAAIMAAANDPSVGHIVLDVDSPGGVSDMIPETAAVIRQARDVKPVTAVANTEAGSAAYWLACQATDISVTRSGFVGSVGVFAIHTDNSEALRLRGVKPTLIKSAASPYKAEFAPFAPLTPEATAAAQAQVDDTAALFIAEIALGRGLDAEYVAENFGKGRMVAATQAVELGMADRIETLQAAIDRILGAGRPGALPSRAALKAAADTETGAPEASPALLPGAEELLSRPGFIKAYSTGR